MNSDRNRTCHWLLEDVADGSTVAAEKCRNSLGGFSNMMDRLAVTLGGRLRSEDQGATWTLADGRTVRMVEMQVP